MMIKMEIENMMNSLLKNRYGIDSEDISSGTTIITVDGDEGVVQKDYGERLEVQFSDGYSREIDFSQVQTVKS